MSWLTGKEIVDKIRKHADLATLNAFAGVFAIDNLPFSVPHYPFFMIVNTQAKNLPGEHWIAVFIDANKRGEVFDSLALPITNMLIRWLNRFTRLFSTSKVMYQHPLAATCGAYVIFYVLHRLKDSQCMTKTFSSFIPDNENVITRFYRLL